MLRPLPAVEPRCVQTELLEWELGRGIARTAEVEPPYETLARNRRERARRYVEGMFADAAADVWARLEGRS